ncbi:MAG: competence/damage-inducible protein A [Actinomycetota bacterium]
MRAELIGVGTELLLGQIANTNAQWISQRLAAVGVDVLHHRVVGDNRERIVDALRGAAARADVVVVTGGLGPTEDDITRDALAEVLGTPMVRRAEIETYLRERFAALGREMPLRNLRQADVPEGTRYLMPTRGTAPGLIADVPSGGTVYLLPGVPSEMREMMDDPILPELASATGSVIVSRIVRCAGIGESSVAEQLADLFDVSENPTVAYLASLGEVKVRLTAKASTTAEAEELIAPVLAQVLDRLGDVVFTVDDETLEEAVSRLLLAAGTRIAVAESLTGGGVAERLTRAPGSSRTFVGGAVTYDVDAKMRVLGVTRLTVETHGVVSRACALEMASGVRKLLGAPLGLSLTGAAGPEPHDGAAPGTVWIALVDDATVHARGFASPGERDQVRRWAEQAALDLVRRHLEARPLPGSDLDA